jgi:ABC-type phosphate/phosphonate transport system substrate-binding protein
MREEIRIVETFGPSPIPPWVIAKRVPETVRRKLQKLLLRMDKDPVGRAILQRGAIARFARPYDSDYHAIRRMARAAEQVSLQA